MTTVPTHTLNDGTSIPAIGFGTYPLTGEDGIRAMVSAVEAGYRLLDTAVNYGNETEVGEAIRRSGVAREDLVVQSKVPGRDHAFDRAVGSVEGTLERLGLEAVAEPGHVAQRHLPASCCADGQALAWPSMDRDGVCAGYSAAIGCAWIGGTKGQAPGGSSRLT